ncbi:hypothetical protein [Pseudomonas abietaniphila]|uniref:Uncharacterized protein n=1 Tax=Pseudomonas abietaniphila TaxID=89065 RepID=A0A1G8LM63_9PSED|nr:hypothetical protein [Pseudomonas abietaniphila]SDI56733.1 hypothetical protein SAMN05216605_114188 [Pseudomonas abietaniphila]
MPAWFKDTEGKVWQYENVGEIKEQNGKYVVTDPYGNLLGAHPTFEIEEFSTVTPLQRVND